MEDSGLGSREEVMQDVTKNSHTFFLCGLLAYRQ